MGRAIKWMVVYIETIKTGREAGLGEGKSMFLLKITGLEGVGEINVHFEVQVMSKRCQASS